MSFIGLLVALSGLFGAATPTPLRVASYNTWLLPLVSAEFIRRRDAMPAALDALEPDVLCLQEVWDQSSLDALGAQLRRRMPYLLEGGGGLALLSRFPVRAWHFEPFPQHESLSLVERIAKKGFISAIIETPSGLLRIVTTHLAWSGGSDRAAHRAELDVLAAALIEPSGLPTILCGDLNFRSAEGGVPTAELRALLDEGFVDPAAMPNGPDGRSSRRAPTRRGWPRNPGHERGWDPDYLLFRAGKATSLRAVSYRQALDTPESALSDHNLQLVDFVLEAAAR